MSKLKKGHRRPGVYMTEIYCGNTSCNARTSLVQTKDFGEHPDPSVWHCPACGKEARVHWKQTLEHYEDEENKLAVGRVNCLLYRRENPDELGVNAQILMLEEPPASWMSALPKRAAQKKVRERL